MRKVFKEHFPASKDEIKKLWELAIFSVDANVVLNLYRYSEETQMKILNVLSYLAKIKRLWISYQVAHEYLKNRLTVIKKQKDAYSELLKKLEQDKNSIKANLESHKRHPYLQIENLKNLFSDAFNSTEELIKKMSESHPDLTHDDPVLERVSEIFDGIIGKEPTHEEYDAIYKEGKKRYDKEVPPGYADLAEKKNDPEQSLYGDLLIWKQIISHAKNQKKDIIFVTDDLKEDWWLKHNGRTISARPELMKEFNLQTNSQSILIYKPEQFLHYSEVYLQQNIGEDAIEEVGVLRKNDETKQPNLQESITEFTTYFDSLNDDQKEKLGKLIIGSSLVGSSAFTPLLNLQKPTPFYQLLLKSVYKMWLGIPSSAENEQLDIPLSTDTNLSSNEDSKGDKLDNQVNEKKN